MVIRALEFYSGIGGLHLALVRSACQAQVVAAFDWDPAACQVYAENHGPGLVKPTDISRLTASDIAQHQAQLWLLSPSCQPYTVLNPNAKGEDDPRAASFLHLIRKVLPELHASYSTEAPRWILIENVAGFEGSTTRQTLIQTLEGLGYDLEEFLLTPRQFGIPNSRLRYYLLARLNYGDFSKSSSALGGLGNIRRSIDPESAEASTGVNWDMVAQKDIIPISCYLDGSAQNEEQFAIPPRVLEKWGQLLDIVKPSDSRSCCFTRSYTKLVEGSGSVLQMEEGLDTTATFNDYIEAVQRNSHSTPLSILAPLRLRYFTPNELLRLFHFIPPPEFEVKLQPHRPRTESYSFKWPQSITTKTKYRLIGNSVNVEVVRMLIDHLMSIRVN